METTTKPPEEVEQDDNVLGLSDEEFLNMDPPEFEEPEEIQDTPPEPEEPPVDDSPLEVADTEETEPPPEDPEPEETAAPVDEQPEVIPDEQVIAQETKVDPHAKGEEVQEPVEPKTEDTVDYKKEYEKIMAPFKANGVQIQPKSVDDVVQLMQMGSNYHKKMTGLKPAMKIMKMLEKHDLMDPVKINYLIDLNQKNPDAIHKLLKESNVDPLTIDIEKDSTYKDNHTTVDDRAIELDLVLDSIATTPSYNRTLTVISDEWDDASRAEIAQHPKVISVLNDQIASGIFDKIVGAMTYERSLGRLTGMSDFEAYKAVGDMLDKQGAFANHPAPPNPENPAPPSPPKPSNHVDTPQTTTTSTTETKVDQREAKKKKLTSTATTPTPKTSPDFNPLALSDEDFEKLDEAQILGLNR